MGSASGILKSIEALDAILARIESRVGLLRAALPVDEAEFVADAQRAVDAVAAIRSEISSSALGIRSGPLNWADRDGLLQEVASLASAVDALREVEARAERLRETAAAIGAGQVVHRSERMRATIEAAREAASEELLCLAKSASCADLPGPALFTEWLGWAGDNADGLQEAGFPEVAEFARAALPDHFVPRLANPPEQSQSLEDGEPPEQAPEPSGPSATPLEADGGEPGTTSALNSPGAHASECVDQEPTEVEPESAEDASEVPAEVPDPVDVGLEATDACVNPGNTASRAPEPTRQHEVATTDIPDELKSYSAFETRYWIDPLGRCSEVPWRDSSFEKKLRVALSDCLTAREPRFPEAWILARAGEALGYANLLTPAEVALCSRLWADPASGLPALDGRPVVDLAQAVTEGVVGEDLSSRFRVVAEALRPRELARIGSFVVEPLVEALGLRKDLLRRVLSEMLRMGAAGIDPVSTARMALWGAAEEETGRAALTERLSTARKNLREFTTKYWRAPAGRLKTDFCRKTWIDFMAKAEALLRPLLPMEKGGAASWNIDEMGMAIQRIPSLHGEIADRAGAKLEDRKVMDRTAQELANAAIEVNEAYRRWLASTSRRPGAAHETWPTEDFKRLVAASEIAGDEGFVHRLLCRVLKNVAAPAGTQLERLAVPMDAVVSRPDLLRATDPELIEEGVATRTLPVAFIKSAAVAAGVLLSDPLQTDDGEGEPTSSLQARLIEPHRRLLRDRLAPLTEGPPRSEVAAEADALFAVTIDKVVAHWANLASAGSGAKDGVRQAVDDAEKRRNGQEPRALDPHLFLEWLARLEAFAEAAVKDTKAAFLAEAGTREEAIRKSVEHAVAENRLGDALRLLAERDLPPSHDSTYRETAWRSDAILRFPKPTEVLTSLAVDSPSLKALLQRWLSGLKGKPHLDKALRELFVEAILRSVGLDAPSRGEAQYLKAQNIREWFARKQLNPSCVPQLSRFSDVVIMVPPKGLAESRFVQATADRVAGIVAGGPPVLPVVLVPRIDTESRKSLLRQFGTRGLVAAVIDDVDLCRLLNPKGPAPNTVLGLFELILEQQSMLAVSPFHLVEGQNVQVEMYFGRREEAKALAETARYSRLFSGRKLGKSALLKYVEAAYNGRPLPSGNTLRVLYVSAVGVDSETGLVDRITESLRAALVPTNPAAPVRTSADPGEKLTKSLKNYLKQRERESLLIVLDEADVFIEEQVATYHQRLEKALSFQMRSLLEAERDSQGLPRIRFVFAGYRVANTSEGAWANWGDVLRLTPLSREDGTDLIERSLSRLGIDCTQKAYSIASRCGFQPAVLIRFGDRLIRRLDQRAPGAGRSLHHCEVTEEDVVLTFEDGQVQEEIRTVVRNNFHGSRASGVVFACLLREFLRYPTGSALADTEDAVLDSLNRYSEGDLSWFVRDASGASGEIAKVLRDLAEREILVEQRVRGSQRVRHLLRFPHHLPVLKPLAEEEGIRADIASLRKEKKLETAEPLPTSLISKRQLQLLQFSLAPASDIRPISIVGTHWQESILDRRVGLPLRLGLAEPTTAASALEALGRGDPPRGPRSAVCGSTPADVERVLAGHHWNEGFPVFIGGIDLLRWAIASGGCELPSGDSSSGVLDAPIGLARLGRSSLAWWFERVRGLNFPTSDALDQILSMTSGIPILVRELDRILVPDGLGGGINLSRDEYESALQAFTVELPSVAKRLAHGDPAERLEKRETELLRMIVTVSREALGSEPLQFLQESYWDGFFRAACPTEPITASDRTPLALLQQAGLLPATGEETVDPFTRLSPLPAGDALAKIVEAMAD